MMDCNVTTRIINAETNEQQLKIHSEELAKVRKLRFVINKLKRINSDKLVLAEKKQVRKAITFIKIGEYIYLNDKRDQVLNLEEVSTINLNYTERKALRQQLILDLLDELRNINKFGVKLRTELPEVFGEADFLQTQLSLLEEERRSNIERLIQIRTRKCNFLKVVAELKMGPYICCELEVLLAKARHNHTKVGVLRGCFINELLTRSEHNLKAIREVEGYINKALEEDQDGSN